MHGLRRLRASHATRAPRQPLILAEDTAPLIAEGVWEGLIIDTPRGAGGFGYDPYFWLEELGVTAAQLGSNGKNRLSHRGIAMRALRTQLLARAQLVCGRAAQK